MSFLVFKYVETGLLNLVSCQWSQVEKPVKPFKGKIIDLER